MVQPQKKKQIKPNGNYAHQDAAPRKVAPNSLRDALGSQPSTMTPQQQQAFSSSNPGVSPVPPPQAESPGMLQSLGRSIAGGIARAAPGAAARGLVSSAANSYLDSRFNDDVIEPGVTGIQGALEGAGNHITSPASSFTRPDWEGIRRGAQQIAVDSRVNQKMDDWRGNLDAGQQEAFQNAHMDRQRRKGEDDIRGQIGAETAMGFQEGAQDRMIEQAQQRFTSPYGYTEPNAPNVVSRGGVSNYVGRPSAPGMRPDQLQAIAEEKARQAHAQNFDPASMAEGLQSEMLPDGRMTPNSNLRQALFGQQVDTGGVDEQGNPIMSNKYEETRTASNGQPAQGMIQQRTPQQLAAVQRLQARRDAAMPMRQARAQQRNYERSPQGRQEAMQQSMMAQAMARNPRLAMEQQGMMMRNSAEQERLRQSGMLGQSEIRANDAQTATSEWERSPQGQQQGFNNTVAQNLVERGDIPGARTVMVGGEGAEGVVNRLEAQNHIGPDGQIDPTWIATVVREAQDNPDGGDIVEQAKARGVSKEQLKHYYEQTTPTYLERGADVGRGFLGRGDEIRDRYRRDKSLRDSLGIQKGMFPLVSFYGE